MMMFFRRKKDGSLSLDGAVRKVFSGNLALSAERLALSKIRRENASDMYEYSCLEETTRYLLWTPHIKLSQTENYIKLLEKKYAQGAFWDFGLTLKEGGKFIGTCGITSINEEENALEIGYVISPYYKGNGYATEAATSVARWCFDTFGIDSIFAKMIEGNTDSQRVMQKLGMSLEGIYRNSMFIKGEYKTIHVWQVKREEFFAKNS